MNLQKIMYSTLIAIMLLVLPLLGICSNAAIALTTKVEQTTYDRVMQSGKLRCGYLVYPPGCIKDPNSGKLSGIGIETVELVAKKLGLTIEWTEEVGWGTMLEGLATGRYDLIATPVWTNANRAKVINFSKPLFYSPVYIFARRGDVRFRDHWQLINSPKVKIACVDGGTMEVIAQDDFPQAKKLSVPQLSDIAQVLLNVANGKADVTFAESTVGDAYMYNNPETVENIDPKKPIRIFASSWMLKRGEFEFKAMLDTVLDEVINSGAMDKIIAKYENEPHEILRVARPYRLPKNLDNRSAKN